MKDEAIQARALELEATVIGTYKLSAKPSLIAEGEFKGKLLSVVFIATSPGEAVRWFAINCGQFESAFSKLIPSGLATEMVDALTRGEAIVFPGIKKKSSLTAAFTTNGRLSSLTRLALCSMGGGDESDLGNRPLGSGCSGDRAGALYIP